LDTTPPVYVCQCDWASTAMGRGPFLEIQVAIWDSEWVTSLCPLIVEPTDIDEVDLHEPDEPLPEWYGYADSVTI
jgi:hypothetical protein